MPAQGKTLYALSWNDPVQIVFTVHLFPLDSPSSHLGHCNSCCHTLFVVVFLVEHLGAPSTMPGRRCGKHYVQELDLRMQGLEQVLSDLQCAFATVSSVIFHGQNGCMPCFDEGHYGTSPGSRPGLKAGSAPVPCYPTQKPKQLA